MIEWIMNCEGSEGKLPWSNGKYYLGRFKEELRKSVTILTQITVLRAEI